MSGQGVELVTPTVTFRADDLSVELQAAEIVLTLGFGMYTTATLTLHKKPEGTEWVDMGNVIETLTDMSGDFKTQQKASVVIDVEKMGTNVETGSAPYIYLEGILNKPGYSAAYGAESTYTLDITTTLSRVSAFNPSIYSLPSKILSTGDAAGKTIAVDPKVRTAKTLGQMTTLILDALVSNYNPHSADLSKQVKDSIHRENKELLEDVKNMIMALDDVGGPDWKALLIGVDINNLIQMIYMALTAQGGDYTQNINRLFTMFGCAWFVDVNPRSGECFFGGLSFLPFNWEKWGSIDSEHAPEAINYMTPMYPTMNGLAPTNVLVEAATRVSLLRINYTPTSLVACYPAEITPDEAVFYKVNAPLWFPDGISVDPIPMSNKPMDPETIEATVHATEKHTLKTRTTIQTLCDTWAELVFSESYEWSNVVHITVPLNLNLQVGALYTSCNAGGSFMGIIWTIRHKIVISTSAITQLTLRAVDFYSV